MFLPDWHKRIKLSYSNRGLRRRRRTRTRRLESLEPRTLLTVTPAAVTITPTEVMDFSTTVATFAADDAGPFTATIDWGDGSTAVVGTVTPAGGGAYDVNGSYAYNEDGPYSLKVTIVDDHNTATPTTANVESTALVAEATAGEGAFAATATAVSNTESTAATTVTAAFTDFETNDPSQFRATIDWGDGTSSAGSVSAATMVIGEQFYNFQVTGDHVYADELAGNYTVTISEPEANFTTAVSNSVTVTDDDAFNVSPSIIFATEGQTFGGTVGAFSDSYTGQVPGDLTASIDWGDGTTTAGSITGGRGSFTVRGDHGYADEGTFPVLVTVADDAPGTLTTTISSSASVGEADAFTPTGTAVTFTGTEGTALSGTLAVFTDIGYPTNDAADLSATIDWGDRQTTTVTPTTAGDGNFTVNGTHTYSDDGGYTITTTINDDSPGTATATATAVANIAEADLSVSPAAATLTSTEGTAFTGTVAILSDPGSFDSTGKYSATIDWGDGTTSAGTIVPEFMDVVYRIVGGHTYADEGTFTVTVTATETIAVPAATATTTFVEAVSEGDAVTSVPTAIAATEGQLFSGAVGTFTDSDTSQVAGDWTASIDWGDGTTTTGTVIGGSSSFTINGVHAYADEGHYTVLASFFDDAPSTLTATITSTANVAEHDRGEKNPVTIAPTEGQAFSGVVGTFTDPGNPLQTAGDWTATVDWGDGTTSTGTVTGPAGGPFTISGQHTYADEGTFTVLAGFFDDAPSTLSATITSTAVALDADAFVATGTTLLATEGTALSTAVATFSDSNRAPDRADFVAEINWGDGTSSVGTITGKGGDLTVNGKHSYTDDGVYTITTSLSDPGGAEAAATSTATVSEASFTLTSGGTLTATEGSAVTGFQLATFIDADSPDAASAFAATIAWGDGVTEAGTIIGGGRLFTVTGKHTYADEFTGSYSVTVSEPAAHFTVGPVTNSVSVVEGDTLTAVEITTGTVKENAVVGGKVAVFGDAGYPNNDPADFSGTFDWGDGTTSTTGDGNASITSDGAGHFTLTVPGHSYADEGTYAVVATIADDAPGTASLSQTGTLTVTEADSFTASLTPVTLVGTEGKAVSGTVAVFSDSGYSTNDPADFSAVVDWGDGTSSAGSISTSGNGDFTIRGNHSYLDEGSYALTISIADDSPGTATATTTAVADIAEASLSLVPAVTVVAIAEGTAFSGALAVLSDPGSSDQASAYQATIDWGDGATTVGTIAGSGGSYTVDGTHTYADEGTYSVTVTASETGALPVATATLAAQIAEGDALVAGTSITAAATEGATFTGTALAVFSDTDYPRNVIGDFAATVDWGDGTTTADTVSGGDGTLIVSANHVYAEEGTQTATIVLSDDAPGTASATATAEIDVADAPLSATGTTIATTEGATFSGSVATFTDADPGATAGDYTATIDWGDGLTTTGTISGNAQSGFQVSSIHIYAEEGGKSIVVTIADVGGSKATAASTANVADATLNASASTITATEGASLTATIATFTDANPSATAADFTATIDWSDGTSSSGTVMADGTGGFQVTATHAYAEEGTDTALVTISDVGGSMAAADSTVLVNDAPLTATGVTIAPTEGSAFSGVVATFTDADPAGTASDYAVEIAWGDGVTTAGTVAASGGHFQVDGTHTYAQAGNYAIEATITDVGGVTLHASHTSSPATSGIVSHSMATAMSKADVGDAPLTANAATVTTTEGAAANLVVAKFTDANSNGVASDYTAKINWGDGSSSDGNVSAAGHGGFQVSATHVYLEEGDYSPTVVIRDIGGSSATAQATAHVADAPLSATSTTLAATQFAAFTGTVATFSDADPNGTLGDYAATIDWGDGSTSTATIAAAGTAFEVNGSHTYAQAGTFAVKVSIADVGGSTAAAQSRADVAGGTINGSAIPINGFELTPLRNVPVATFISANGSQPSGGFQATINWGDGTSSTGIVSESGTTYTVTGSHEYLDEGTFAVSVQVSDPATSATITTAATILEELLPNGTEGTPNQRFVQEMYRDLLHRAADPAGLNFWTGLLDQGVSRQDVATGMIAASMFNELGADLVTGIFEKFLNRDPDPTGMSFWITIISQRETIEDTEANVVGTPEFFYLAGSTDTGFITRLYRLALGRDPEQSAIDYFNTLLANGMTREKVAEIVLNSLEYRQDEIRGYYQSPDDVNELEVGAAPFIDDIDFFDRPADAIGLQTFSIEAEQGVLDQQIWAQMLGSDEFFAKIAE